MFSLFLDPYQISKNAAQRANKELEERILYLESVVEELERKVLTLEENPAIVATRSTKELLPSPFNFWSNS